jgi:hypothetical protein
MKKYAHSIKYKYCEILRNFKLYLYHTDNEFLVMGLNLGSDPS